MLEIFCSIQRDPSDALQWLEQTLRPQRNLVRPSEAYVQGLKVVRPALHFNTFNAEKAKCRRVDKQRKDQSNATQRRKAMMAPTAALKAALNPKRLPPGSQATPAENRLLMKGEKNKRAVERHISQMRAKRRLRPVIASTADDGNTKQRHPATASLGKQALLDPVKKQRRDRDGDGTGDGGHQSGMQQRKKAGREKLRTGDAL